MEHLKKCVDRRVRAEAVEENELDHSMQMALHRTSDFNSSVRFHGR